MLPSPRQRFGCCICGSLHAVGADERAPQARLHLTKEALEVVLSVQHPPFSTRDR
jgi:hypothetical protein